MDIGTLTSFFTLDVLLGRGSVVVRDRFVRMRVLLLLFSIFIGLSKSTIDAGSELIVCGSLSVITFSSFAVNGTG